MLRRWLLVPTGIALAWLVVQDAYANDAKTQIDVFGAQDAYRFVNLKATYQLSENASVGFGVDNVTNEEAYVFHPWPARTMYAELSVNFFAGLLVALGVIGMSVSGVVMWWQRRPKGSLAAPPLPADRRLSRGIALAVLGLAAFLPLVAASLIAVVLAESLWGRLGSARVGRTQPST